MKNSSESISIGSYGIFTWYSLEMFRGCQDGSWLTFANISWFLLVFHVYFGKYPVPNGILIKTPTFSPFLTILARQSSSRNCFSGSLSFRRGCRIDSASRFCIDNSIPLEDLRWAGEYHIEEVNCLWLILTMVQVNWKYVHLEVLPSDNHDDFLDGAKFEKCIVSTKLLYLLVFGVFESHKYRSTSFETPNLPERWNNHMKWSMKWLYISVRSM